MELTEEEKSAFEELFVKADVDKDGAVGVGDARTFYSSWGLSPQVLALIWSEANTNKQEALSKQEFFVSLRLVALAQQQQTVSNAEAIAHKGPLIPVPVAAAAAAVPAAAANPWVVSQQQYQTFEGVFNDNDTDKDGYITGQQARELFLSYQIPVADLKLIWELSDIDKDERLSKAEFMVAMYLILRKKGGDAIPGALPNTLMPSIGALVGKGPKDWTMTPEEQEHFHKVFVEADADGDGYVTGDEARTVFMRSNLELQELRKVWDLVDPGSDKMNEKQFSVAMCLIARALKGDALPDTLPASLRAAAGQEEPTTATPTTRGGILAQVQQQAQQTIQENTQLRSSLQEAEERHQQQEVQHKEVVTKLSGDVEVLKTDLAAQRRTADMLSQEINTLRAQQTEDAVTHAQEELSNWQEHVKSLTTLRDSIKEAVQSQQQQLSSLRTQVTTAQQEADFLRKEVQVAAKELQDLQRATLTTQQQLKGLREASFADAKQLTSMESPVVTAPKTKSNPFDALVASPLPPAQSPTTEKAELSFDSNFNFEDTK